MTPRPRDHGDGGDLEIVRTVSRFAELPLDGERLRTIAELLPGARGEQDILRRLPSSLEPHVVFDPRWE